MLLIISPNPFISKSSPDNSPQPRIDFSYYEISGPDICSLICALHFRYTTNSRSISSDSKKAFAPLYDQRGQLNAPCCTQQQMGLKATTKCCLPLDLSVLHSVRNWHKCVHPIIHFLAGNIYFFIHLAVKAACKQSSPARKSWTKKYLISKASIASCADIFGSWAKRRKTNDFA